MMIFNIVTYSVVAAGLLLTVYWMRGTVLFNRSTTLFLEAARAYRRGDAIVGDDMYAKAKIWERRAKRWSLGTRSKEDKP